MRLVFSFLILSAFVQLGFSQNGLVHHYSFNNCNGVDEASGNDGFLFGINDCPCGVDGSAISLTNPVQFGDFPQSINDLIRGDYTFSFYMWPRNPSSETRAVDIWSINDNCNVDTTFQIRYFPQNNEIRVLIADGPRSRVMLNGMLTSDYCWSYVALTKSENEYKLFIDKEEVARAVAPVNSTFSSNDVLSLSVSSCTPISERFTAYQGLLDELRIYDKPLTDSELAGEDYYPNQIIEDNVVVFKGESVLIETGGACTDQFTWSPIDGLSDETTLMPVATPEQSTFYDLTIEYDDCTIIDQINIVVVDVEELDCEDLLLPAAFTPNGDGLNDEFGISNGFILESLLSFEIFDKWGGRLYYATDNVPTWDGNFRNQPVMPGPYLYRVKYVCNGVENIRNGVVNVIK